MPNVFTARDLKAALKLPFCYICGDTLNWEESTRDHVPPKGCFAQQDRMHNPVVLPTHSACNNSFKVADESLGQFLSLLHGKKPKPGASGVRFTTSAIPGRAVNKNVNLYGAIERWVRAFHAALYQQPMPDSTKFAIELPIEVLSADRDGDPEFIDSGRPEQRTLCEKTIENNRSAGAIDRLVGWNGKLQYECVWVPTPLHSYCVFWIDLYGWRRLAKVQQIGSRECVGFYSLFPSEQPPGATVQTTLITDDNPARFLF